MYLEKNKLVMVQWCTIQLEGIPADFHVQCAVVYSQRKLKR
jgi:hypothetical protein